jgi:hypothetical protein
MNDTNERDNDYDITSPRLLPEGKVRLALLYRTP